MKPYFHELTDEHVQNLIDDGAKVSDIMDNYLQPDWCDYPDALAGLMGCWSLTDLFGLRHSIGHEYCKNCECYKPIDLNKQTV